MERTPRPRPTTTVLGHAHPSPENTAPLPSDSATRTSGLPQDGSSLGFYLAHSNPVALNFNFSSLPPPHLGGILTMSGDIWEVTTSRGAGRSPGLMGRA